MATTIKFKRGTTAQVEAVTPVSGEPLYDETLDQLRIGDGVTAGGDKVVMVGLGNSQTFMVNNFVYPNPGTDWTPGDNGAYLGSSKSAKIVYIPLNFLKIGDIITSYNLVGDAIITGTSTLDCKIVRVNKADPLTTTDLTSGAIAQITTDGNFDSTANVNDEAVATDKQYYLRIVATTDATDEFYVIGAEIVITRLP